MTPHGYTIHRSDTGWWVTWEVAHRPNESIREVRIWARTYRAALAFVRKKREGKGRA